MFRQIHRCLRVLYFHRHLWILIMIVIIITLLIINPLKALIIDLIYSFVKKNKLYIFVCCESTLNVYDFIYEIS